MTKLGKKLTIYLIDGSEFGARTIDVGNWSGRAIYSPRGLISEILLRPEFEKPGIYILKSVADDDLFSEKIYIGESEVLRTRIKQHLQDEGKSFFTEIVAFISKDELLTKSHIKYLESRLIQLANEAKTAQVENGTAPSLPFLSEADISDMEYFLEQIKLILPVTGFNFLKSTTIKKDSNTVDNQLDTKKYYNIKSTKLIAKMYKNNQGYVVVANSQCSKTNGASLGKYWTRMKEKFIEQGVLIDKGSFYEFTEDTVFESPSAASSIILGSQSAGPQVWIDETNKSLKENEQ